MYTATVKFKKAAVTIAAIGFATVIMLFSTALKEGVAYGLRLCVNSVIPSLFLFTAAALFIVSSNAAATVGKIISPITRFLFGIDGQKAAVVLISTVAGYPVGARLLDSLYAKREISRQCVLRLLTCCVNAGPAFIITAIGENVLNSRSDGVRLLIAHLSASLIMLFITRFLPFFRENSIKTQITSPAPRLDSGIKPSLSDSFVQSVADAGQTMLTVCIFVVFFGSIGHFTAQLPFKQAHSLAAVIEVTSGVVNYTRQQLPQIAFLLGFAGISVIFQVASQLKSCKVSLLFIVVTRLIHGLISAGIIAGVEYIFPRSDLCGSLNVRPLPPKLYTSPTAAAGLLFLCLTILAFCQKTRSVNN